MDFSLVGDVDINYVIVDYFCSYILAISSSFFLEDFYLYKI